MTVGKMKELLSKFGDDQQVLMVKGSRIGHDDAIKGFSVQEGFACEGFGDVRLEKGVQENDDFEEVEGDLNIDYCIPTCVIVSG